MTEAERQRLAFQERVAAGAADFGINVRLTPGQLAKISRGETVTVFLGQEDLLPEIPDLELFLSLNQDPGRSAL
jgi:hypothetical protein